LIALGIEQSKIIEAILFNTTRELTFSKQASRAPYLTMSTINNLDKPGRRFKINVN
jgi:hypothetical protein